jgi:hypothetical protein
MSPGVDSLAGLHDGIRLDTTGRTPEQTATDLQHALVRHG